MKIKIFIKNNVKSSRLAAVCVIVVITIIGVYLLYPSHATGPYTTAEAETGVYAGGASPASSTSASGGSYIKYASGSSSGIVDSSTIANKFMLGFQGWFQCPTDGSPNAAWLHWFSGTPPTGPLTDFWPDVSELTLAEKCDTGLKLPNGSPAYLFSDYNAQTVLRQFQWMQQYNIDGVMLQRFASELSDPRFLAERNQVTQNVMNAANSTGRTFDIMYDISGQSESTLVSTIENDWTSLVNTQNVTKNAHYLHQNGKPIVVLWGFGFSGRPGTPADLTALLNFFHKNSNPALDATVMGGVDNNWRSDTTWTSTFDGFDIIAPWAVGRYAMSSAIDSTSVSNWVNANTVPDLTYAKAHNLMYLPDIWPGYSFHNQNSADPLNQDARYGGNFLWQQAYYTLLAEKNAGMPQMMYGSMFDEMNEGTALFKQATSSAMWPSNLTMVPLNTDGYTQLPSDWYLQVSGQINEMTNGTIPLSKTMTITPH